MARIDLKNRAIQAKLVYYGPGLCGKTTNLQYINAHMAGGQELMSLATEGDRTIFFDFMPLDLGKLRGLDVKFKLYTVPGQVRYNQTRKMVLKNVDGVVFVADSQTEMIDANLESLDNLFENLRELGIDPDEVPVVLQYNKRDLPNVMSTKDLDTALNSRSYSTFMASAFTGDGVVDTLKAACKEVLGYLSKSLPGREEAPAAPDATTSARASSQATASPSNGASAAAGAAPAGEADKKTDERERTPAPAAGQPTEAPSLPGHEAIAELSQTLAAVRQELAELRGPAHLDEDTFDKLANRLVDKADMVVLHRRLDGVEEVAQNTGTLVAELLERIGAVAGQLETLGGSLAKRLEERPAGEVELGAQFEKLPTKADLAGLAKKLEPIGQAPTKKDLAELAKKLEPIGQAPTKKDLAELAKKLEPIGQAPTKKDLAELAKKLERLEPAASSAGSSKSSPGGAAQATAARDLEALSAKLGGIAEQLSTWTASRTELVASKQTLEAAARREDLGELRAAMVKLAARIESGQSAPASPGPSKELRELAARLESMPTKAELDQVEKRLAALPTQGDLERLEKTFTRALAEVRTLAAERSAAPASAAPAAAQSEQPTDEAASEAGQAAPVEAAGEAEQAKPAEAAGEAEQAEPAEAASETGQAEPAEAAAEAEDAAAPESTPDAGAPDAEQSAEAESAEAESAETESANKEAEAESANKEAEAEQPTDEARAADQPTEEAAAAEQPAEEAEAAATGEPPPAAGDAGEVDDNSPEQQNAARVARVMVADLYLYNKEQVEAGIREGDFFERNHEALEDMRLTFESRVPEDVRATKDHLRLAIDAFIEKKRAKLTSS